jgi:hypothetical protein
MRALTCRFIAAIALIAIVEPRALADYDPAREYVESPAVARRYADPDIVLRTPGFVEGRRDFTSHAEMLAFLNDALVNSPDMRVRIIGRSQQGRAIPLVIMARGGSASSAELLKNGRPTLLIIGLQHGNEPAGGEAALAFIQELASPAGAPILDRINVLIVPRANPDGAAAFVRGLADGGDVNRDHLLVATPEGAALATVNREFQPDIVLDCHEFGVRTRWFEKFGGLQRHDALIQYATVSNLPPPLTELADRMFRAPLLAALEQAGFSDSWYYASSYDMGDKVVSMGGVVPDTGRNISGLRNAVSFLIETRGVGIGRAHFKRRVATHLTAMRAFARAAAEHADALVAELRRIRASVAASAGQGDVAVVAAASSARHTIDLLDPDTGADKPVEVDWRDALAITVRLARPRPFGYVLAATESRAVARLRALGVTVLRLDADGELDSDRYEVTTMTETRKEDVRRNDEDTQSNVLRLTTRLVRGQVRVHRGDWYVPLDQPLANVIVAALEPEPQSSYASNRLLSLPSQAGMDAFLPLYRVPTRVRLPTVEWNGAE